MGKIPSRFIPATIAAAREFPITGSVPVDTALLLITALLESGFRSGTIKSPASTALGYFQIIRANRQKLAKIIGPWDDSYATQARYAAYLYRETAKWLRSRPSRIRPLIADAAAKPNLNFIYNLRFRYASGPSERYVNHPDAVTTVPRLTRLIRLIKEAPGLLAPWLSPSSTAEGDGKSGYPLLLTTAAGVPVYCLHANHLNEFKTLPGTVKDDAIRLFDSFSQDPLSTSGGNIFITSILSDKEGRPRTPANGPNHAQGVAIDFVPTPFTSFFFIDQEGRIRDPRLHTNEVLIKHVQSLHRDKPFKSSVLIEQDHIHIDSNHAPGVSRKTGGRTCYHNDLRAEGHAAPGPIKRLTR